jgi:dolichol-phosphate mannosyltransferase
VTLTGVGLAHHAGIENRPVGRVRVGHQGHPTHPDQASPSRRPRQSLVIPTFNERDNISTLLTRLTAILPAADTEIIFVDDSTDNTPDVITRLAAHCPIPVRLNHRTQPVGGLGGAVVEGLRLARGTWVVVMDADLQHPPEVVPELIAAGTRDGADLVVASRYLPGGRSSGLADAYRRTVSGACRVGTKLLFHSALTQVSDPMSGFFTVRASSLDLANLRPLGYKILLELLVRNRPGRVVEVPYAFETRYAGASKSTLAEGWRFVRHLATLRFGGTRLRSGLEAA